MSNMQHNGHMIALDNLTYRYPGADRDALRGISVEIAPATVTSILGPNGSGKTTLLNLLLGLTTPTAGGIRINGGDRQEGRRLLGLVPQDEQFPLGFTVADYVLLGRAPHLSILQRPSAKDRRIAYAAIERVEITDLAGRYVMELSCGERQMAMIARALAQQPQVLLMDEPGSHLDLANRARVMALVRGLTTDGVTVMMTTHDPNAAAAVSDAVVLMRDGGIVRQGTLADAMTSESLTATYGLPVKVVQIEGRLLVIDG